jgi:tripartite-type tricarboxylate transporter receptor subunit TctC
MQALIARGLCGIAMSVAFLAPAVLHADPVADFYRDKTVSITVPGGPGASLALYCQLIAAHWKRHIPGNPTLMCQHRPGAGGTLGAAYMYNVAPRDGTAIGEIQSASVLAPALRKMKFDVKKFVWLGSMTSEPSVIAVWHKAPATTVEGAKHVEVLMGSTGTSSETYITPTLMNKLLGTKFRIVQGYTAGNINLAMERGEVHGRWSPWANWVSVHPDWVRDKWIVPLVQYGPKVAELPDVPYLKDLIPSDEGKQMITFVELASQVGKGFFLPPGVPADRVAALRSSFMATMKDEAFLAAAAKVNAEINPIPGEALQQTVDRALTTPESVLAKMRDYLGYEK